MKNSHKTFGLLFAAYAISITYQYYRYTLQEVPAYDTFGKTEIVGYLVAFGWSSLSLINRKWALKSVLALCALQLAIGLFYYFPVIFPQRHDYFWDWAEAIVFILLIAIAGYSAFTRLTALKKVLSYQ